MFEVIAAFYRLITDLLRLAHVFNDYLKQSSVKNLTCVLLFADILGVDHGSTVPM
jgi:hypothetical protein